MKEIQDEIQDDRRVLDLRRPDTQNRFEKLRVEDNRPALDQGLSPPQAQPEIEQLRQALALQQQQIAAFLGPQHQQQQLAGLLSPQHQQLPGLLSPQIQQGPGLFSPQHQQISGLLGAQQIGGPRSPLQQHQLAALLNSQGGNQQLSLQQRRQQLQQQQQQQQRAIRPKTLNFQRFQKNKKKKENSRKPQKSLSVFSKPHTTGGAKVKKSTAKLQREEFSRQRAITLLNLH